MRGWELRMNSKEELIAMIKPDMKLTESFFKAIYGYELTYPGFAEMAMIKFMAMGSKNARVYYKQFSEKYENEARQTFRNVGVWYIEQLERKWEERKMKRERQQRKVEYYQNMTDKELLEKYEQLKKETEK